ncbi:MAG: TetR/AcrR family transcriptional regulator [Bauldia sp.]|nr:TetR/AcrR family transcriptional regulator [Bauldia sp.]
MTEEIAGRGDPLKTLRLLWRKTGPPKRGPKPRVSLDDVVTAAIAIADREGLEAVTTRRVAEAVGIAPMSFYTYVPGKAELLDLMLDAVAAPGDRQPPGWGELGWRARLEIIANALWNFYLQHPWVLQIATHRPTLGPKTLAAYEVALSAVDGVGLDEIEMDMVFGLVASYVHGAVRDAARARMVKDATGMTDDEWWHRIAPFLETIDYSPYPIASRVGPVTGAAYGVGDPDRAFRFGLDRILDGIALLIASKETPPG